VHTVPGHGDDISGADMLKQLREKLAQQDLQMSSGEIVGFTCEAEHLDTRVLGRVTNSRVMSAVCCWLPVWPTASRCCQGCMPCGT